MEVNWYRKYLLEKYRELKKLKKQLQNEKIDFTMLQIEDFIYDCQCEVQPEPTLIQMFQSEYRNLKHDKIVWKDIQSFHEKYEELDYDPSLLDISLSDSQLFELTHDFYKNCTPKTIFCDFLYLFSQRKDHVGIFRNNDASVYGDTIYLPYYKEAFIQVFPKDMFLDAAVLTHEYGHALYDLNHFHPKLLRENYTFLEIISTFFEYIFYLHYSHHKELKKHAITSLIDTFEERREQSENLASFIKLVEYMGLPECKTVNEELNTIQDFINVFGNDNLQELIEQGGISGDIIYVFATSIVTELLYIYYEDPDMAFYLLDKIMKIDPRLPQAEYYQEIIKLGIIPNANLDKINNHLKRELTLIK